MGTRTPGRVLSGENPFGVDPDHYMSAATPDYQDALWSETHFWSAWNPDEGVGLFIHVGTTPEDPDLWWAQVVAYLPGGRLCVQRLWGQTTGDSGVSGST